MLYEANNNGRQYSNTAVDFALSVSLARIELLRDDPLGSLPARVGPDSLKKIAKIPK